MKERIKIDPNTIVVIVISIICLIIGINAVGISITIIVIGILNAVYFKNEILEFIQNKSKSKKKNTLPKEKKTKEKNSKEKVDNLKKEEKPIYEYKVGDEIITTGDDNMKKKNKKTKSEKKPKEKKKKKLGWKIFQCFLLFCCFCFVAGVVGVTLFLSSIVKNAPDFNPENLYSIEPSKIIAEQTNTVLATLGTENRKIITYDEIPEVFINALIATEDARFFQHNGIDLSRFLVASIKQVLGQHDAGGASTLTMQLSKNYIVADDTATGIKGIKRKFTDVYISVFKIEPTYTKEEIIEFYVNSGQLGSRYGIEAASQLYFQKSAKDMNISESALLAGMFQAPSRYNPIYHPEAAEKRRKTVLYIMRRHEYITQEQYEIALKLTVDKIVKAEDDIDTSTADVIDDVNRSAVDTIVKEVIATTGKDPRKEPMTIYTTIDPKLQKHVGNIMMGNTYKWENNKVQAGIAVVDVKTGAIKAVGGNRVNNKSNVTNHATDENIDYQIGSTSKPLYDYAPAIEYLNWSTGTVIADEKITYSDGTPIHNSDNKYRGFDSIRTQLQYSRNIPALKTFQKLDKSKIQSFVTSLGLHPESNLHEAHSIGGYNGENPLDMAAAYAAFGNGGYYTEPYSVTKIVFSKSGQTKIISKNTKQVMSSSTAYMVTNMLQDAATYGIDAGKYKAINGVPYAGKTGTTNFTPEVKKQYKFPSNAVKDLWAVGYNTEYAIGVWYGYDSNKDGCNRLGSMQHARLFQAVAKGIFTNKADFKMPDTVTKVKIEKDSATLMLPSEYTPKEFIKEELFVAGTEPTTVSTRFAKLPNITNLSTTANLSTVTLTWTPIATPDALNLEYIKELNKSAYYNNSALETHAKNVLNKNKSYLGNLEYNIYMQTESGLTLLGTTQSPTFTFTAPHSGELKIVVKTSYSKFKSNSSDGVNTTLNLSFQEIPNPNPDNPNQGL